MTVNTVGRTTSSSSNVPVAMLSLGSKGPEVVALQKALAAAGFDPHGFDGSFGPKTQAAVLAFQRARGLVVDGRAGPQTWNALRGAAPAAPSSTPSTKMLQLGSRGPEVVALQRSLAAAGFDPHGFDGSFGPKTQAAVTAFQRARGLVVDGRAGPQTMAALGSPAAGPTRPVLRQGDLGANVRELQTRLLAHGFRPGPVDGQFGAVTRGAVVEFQRARGLAGSGVVDAQTWTALLKAPPAAGPTGPTSTGIQSMLTWAKSMIGCPYAAVNPFRFGEVLWDGKPHQSVNGSGTVWNYPKGTRVFDCSGFVVAAYRQLGVDLAARNLYSTSTFQADTKFLQPLSREQLAPGDLILYQPTNGIGHVVIYLGGGKAIEAAGGAGVTIRDVDWGRVKSYRRVPLPG